MIDRHDVTTLSRATVRTSQGDKIGKVAQVYLDDHTGEPAWVTVRTGLFDTMESVVPLAAARLEHDLLVVDVTLEQVNGAPRVDTGGRFRGAGGGDLPLLRPVQGHGFAPPRTGRTPMSATVTGAARPDRRGDDAVEGAAAGRQCGHPAHRTAPASPETPV